MALQQTRIFVANEVLFTEGEQGECAYLIERGSVQIFIKKDDGEIPLRVLGEGEIVGEMSLIENNLRSACCRAMTDGQAIIITKEQLLDRINVIDPIIKLILKAMLERLRTQNDILRNKKIPAHKPTPSIAITKEKKIALDRITLEHKIACGLEDDEFLPYYQPIYDLSKEAIVGCEALMRWHSKEQGVVSPAVFMDAMDSSPMIIRAGKMMIEKSLTDLKQLAQHVGRPESFFVSINVSGRQFGYVDFLNQLEDARNRIGVPSAQIKLELTESIMTGGPQALKVLNDCRNLGYKLAVDDFGTGFSSLQYLARMPLTDLKVDRSFIKLMREDQKSLHVVQCLIYMAKLLGLTLTAEGIETAEQLNHLKLLGIELGQGFLFAKPLPLAEFLKLNSKLIRKAA